MQQNQKYFALADAHGKLVHRFLLVSNIATRGSVGDRPRQRARAARAARRREVLLRPGPQAAARVARRAPARHRLSQQARHAGTIASSACAFSPATSRPRIGADARARGSRGAAGEGGPRHRHGRRIPRAAGHDGPLLRAARRRSRPASPTRSRSTTGRASPATRCPTAPIAQAVALADKLETLAGLFGIGAVPTGDKDPFGLRRAALGVLRILIEKRLALPLPSLLGLAFQAFNSVPATQPVPDALADFLYERLRGYLREQGYTANQVEAVLAQRPQRIDLVPEQLRGRAGVRGAARSGRAVRREQAHRQHPAEERRRRGGECRRRTARRRAPSATFGSRSRRWPRKSTRHCAGGDYTRALKALAAVEARRRPLLRRRDGDGRRCRRARQPARAA